MPSSSLRYSRLVPRGRSAVVSSSPGLSLILCGPGGGGGRNGAGGGSGGAGGGPGAGAVPSTGRGGGRGEEVRDKTRGEQVRERGSGEQVRDGGVGVEGRDIEGGGERLLRRPHCSLFSLLLMAGRTCRRTQFAPLVPGSKLSTATSYWCFSGESATGNVYCDTKAGLWAAVEPLFLFYNILVSDRCHEI